MIVIRDILEVIGFFTTVTVLWILTMDFADWFKRWRKKGCKIKCLCKHIYEIQYILDGKKMYIKCKTCGKHKKLHFDEESLNTFGFE